MLPPRRLPWSAVSPDESHTWAFPVDTASTAHLSRRGRAQLQPVLPPRLARDGQEQVYFACCLNTPRLFLAHSVWHRVGRPCCCGERRQKRVVTVRMRHVTTARWARWGGPARRAARPGRARARVRGAVDRGVVEVCQLDAVAGREPLPTVASAGGILGSLWAPGVALAALFAAPPPDTRVARPRRGDDRWELRGGSGGSGLQSDPRAHAMHPM